MPANRCCGRVDPPPPPPPPPPPGAELVAKWAHVLNDPWIQRCPTWTEQHCLAYLAELASKSSVMVEYGTYVGASALVMLRANPSLHLWTVDHFQAFFGNEAVARHYLHDELAQGRCEIIIGNSARAAGMLSHMLGKIDACFCDDGHESHQVLSDITHTMPLLKSGGTMAGHDYDEVNDVAQGVKSSLLPFTVPVPRMWLIKKP